jgi:menaquinol-cytochrome c reductase cytochrome b subunit
MSAMGKIGSRTAEAGRSVVGWVEDRTGVLSWLARFLNHPAPKRGAWMYALGTTALFLMTLQFLTGILLLFYYAPTTDHAWNSIYYIMNEAYFGQLIRGIHYWSANVLLAIIGLHMVQVFLSGAYKAPREVNWMLGVTLLLLTLGIAFTGYVLRWDQDGFWATVVGVKIGSYSPFVGSPVTHFLLGGDVAGPATLSRFFALHVWVLPALIVPLVLLHGVVLVLKHRVFGSEMEYRDRIARLRERRRLQEYGRYEDDKEGSRDRHE